MGEPASPTAILQTELARDSSLKTVSEFDKSNLKKAETMEKNPLPSSEAIAQELEHLKSKAGMRGTTSRAFPTQPLWKRTLSQPRNSLLWRRASRLPTTTLALPQNSQKSFHLSTCPDIKL